MTWSPSAHPQASFDGSGPAISPVRLIDLRVEDRPGVLQRVTNCLSRRGLRLETCTVGQCGEPGVLSLWMRVGHGSQSHHQVVRQLAKLIDVVSVEDLTEEAPVEWSMALVELCTGDDDTEVEAALTRLEATVISRRDRHVIAALGGPPAVLAAALVEIQRLPLRNWVCSRPMALGSRDRNRPGERPLGLAEGS